MVPCGWSDLYCEHDECIDFNEESIYAFEDWDCGGEDLEDFIPWDTDITLVDTV